jgi:hypothetical protein
MVEPYVTVQGAAMTGKVPIREPMLCPELFSFMVTMAKSKLFEVSIEFDVLLGITDLNFGSLRANAWVASGDARGGSCTATARKADWFVQFQPHAELAVQAVFASIRY